MSRLATPLSALAIVGASVALVACGSSDDSSTGGASAGKTGTTRANGTQSAAFAKYQQCLKDNGVTLPDRGQRGASSTTPPAGGAPGGGAPGAGAPGGMPGGVDSEKFQKAQTACAKLRPQGMGQGGPGGGYGQPGARGGQQDIKAFTPYLNCLKGEGLDVKVADGFNALRNLKQDDAKVQAAFKACQSKLPQRPGNGGGASSATPAPTTTS
jgi:hypothetical protein